MKTLTTLVLLFLSIACFGQVKDTPFQFPLSAYEKAKVAEHETMLIQVAKIQREVKKADSTYSRFITDMIGVNAKEKGIDWSRISLHTDSLKISSDKIELKLRKKKE